MDGDRPWLILGLSLLVLVGCGGGGVSEGERSRLLLDQGWSNAPWKGKSAGAPALDLETTIRLPRERWAGAADLVLEGLWWRARITVDDELLPEVTGGAFPVRVSLGDHLADGNAHIAIRITPPTKADGTVLTGGLLINSRDRAAGEMAWLASPPVLETHPAQELRFTTLVAQDGGAVTPIAWVHGGFVGQHIRFRATLDGQTIQELGEATLAANGEARAPQIRWKGPRWSPRDPALLLLESTLLDEEGAVIDQRADRTGVRHLEVRGDHLAIDDAPLRIHAMRQGYHRNPSSLGDYLLPFLGAGINTVEFHGELVPETWMQEADELGLPVARVPRCGGLAGQQGPVPEGREAELALQDQRLIESQLYHPSLLLWVEEQGLAVAGGPGKRLGTELLDLDPLQRPAVPRDLPGIAYDGHRQASPCLEQPCRGSFVLEVHPHPDIRWDDVAHTWLDTLQAGLWGGVLPSPEPDKISQWTNAFSSALSEAGVEPWPKGERRASAELRLSGLSPGETVWLSCPGQVPQGAVADSSGAAVLRAWFRGEAILRWSGGERSVHLEPQTWSDMTKTGSPVVLNLQPPP